MAKRGKNSKKHNKSNKRGQEIFGLSFGMIFAVILIIFFVVIAIIVINNFLCTRDQAKVGMFFSDLNKKVEDAWNSGDITSKFSIDLPTNVEAVCFANLDRSSSGKNKAIGDILESYPHEDNLFLYVPKGSCVKTTSYNIKHLNLENIIRNENPYCIKLTKGAGALVVEMNNGENLVRVARE